MTVRALLGFLGKGNAGENAKVPLGTRTIHLGALNDLWQAWLDSDYLGRNFYVYLPPKKSREEQLRLNLRLTGGIGASLPWTCRRICGNIWQGSWSSSRRMTETLDASQAPGQCGQEASCNDLILVARCAESAHMSDRVKLAREIAARTKPRFIDTTPEQDAVGR